MNIKNNSYKSDQGFCIKFLTEALSENYKPRFADVA